MDNEAVFPLDEPINLEYLFSYAAQNREPIAWDTAKRELELYDLGDADLRRCERCFGTGIFEGMDADEAKRCVSCKGDGWLPC